jgi:hypothetical protein
VGRKRFVGGNGWGCPQSEERRMTVSDDDRCRAVFHHRCTKRMGHGGAHESGDSAELLAEVERLRAALELVCNVGDRAAVMTAREALAFAGWGASTSRRETA